MVDLPNIFIGARTILSDPARWCQGNYFLGDQRCLVGACADAAGIKAASDERLTGLVTTIEPFLAACLVKRTGRGSFLDVIDFNDATTTEHKDVLAVLD